MDLVNKMFVSKQWKKHVWLYNYENIFSFKENMLCAFNTKIRNTVESPLTAPSLQQPLFLVDSPYVHSCFNLSTMATLFCPQGGRCEGVQLYCCKC